VKLEWIGRSGHPCQGQIERLRAKAAGRARKAAKSIPGAPKKNKAGPRIEWRRVILAATRPIFHGVSLFSDIRLIS